MATGFEIMASRGGSLSELRRRYMVLDATDEQDVLDWATAQTPTSLQGLARSGFSMQENDELANAYEIEVSYGTTELPPTETDQVDYLFNYQAKSAHIYQSLATISGTAASGTAPDFDGAINVVEDNGGQRVEGLALPVPSEVFTLRYAPANATITPAYQLLVESLVGLVNSVAFKGRPAGSLMLVRAQGQSRNAANWSIEFGWGYIANATDIAVGDSIVVPAKDGLDLLWAYYESATDATAKSLIRRPRAAYVERVFNRGDFNALGL